MLEVRNLHATIAGKEILRGINLTIKDGEIHAIMGPNGSGKSTLSAVLTGNPLYEVTDGMALFNGKNLLEMKPEDRSHEGLFLSFQYPVEIPGVSMTNFMKAAINAKRAYEGLEPMKAAEFMALMREKRQLVGMDSTLSRRSVNEGFSGGEKKRNEIFQMAMLEPKLSILDETDSGLDVDAMRNNNSRSRFIVHLVYTLSYNTHSINVKTRVCLIKNTKLWLQHCHLENLVALLLTTRETLVYTTAREC